MLTLSRQQILDPGVRRHPRLPWLLLEQQRIEAAKERVAHEAEDHVHRADQEEGGVVPRPDRAQQTKRRVPHEHQSGDADWHGECNQPGSARGVAAALRAKQKYLEPW